MSATNRGRIRVDSDAYYTPAEAMAAGLEPVLWHKVRTACEPAAGDGRIVRAIETVYSVMGRREVDVHWYEVMQGRDYLADEKPPAVDVTITNPPYSHAKEFVEHALKHSRLVLMLLRLNFLGSQQRRDWWRAGRQPSHLYVLSKRPVFVHSCKDCESNFYPRASSECPACGGTLKKGTDATEYAWFGWGDTSLLREPPGIYVV